MKPLVKILITAICMLLAVGASAESKKVTMSVGETQTLYLPSSVTSKSLKAVNFYSNGISYVQVVSSTTFSVTVKAVKAFSSPIIVRCDYYYFVPNGRFTYEAKGYFDFMITVVGDNKVQPTQITFPTTVKVLYEGESYQLTPTVYPENAEYTLSWSINYKSVATVSQTGLLVGVSEGEADLTVKADNGVYAMLRVVVKKPLPSSVSVRPSSLDLIVGDQTYLTATVYPSNSSQKVTWTSSNPAVATVSTYGRVTAIGAGRCTITAKTSNNYTAKCAVEVTPREIMPESITLAPENAELEIGEIFVLTPTIMPENATPTIVWTSSDALIAAVNHGTVNAISAGTCTITATTVNGLSATTNITVKPDEPVVEPSADWNGSYWMNATVEIYDDATYAYPDEFTMEITEGDDGNSYITSFLGFDVTKSYPHTGLRLNILSDTEASIDLSYSTDAGSWTLDHDSTGGLHLISPSSEYNSLDHGNIFLTRMDDGNVTISEFYIFYFGQENDFGYTPQAHYAECTSSLTPTGVEIIHQTMPANELLEIFSLTGRSIYIGSPDNIPPLDKGIYIIRQSNKTAKFVKSN